MRITSPRFLIGPADVQLLQAVRISLNIADREMNLRAHWFATTLIMLKYVKDPFIELDEKIIEVALQLLEFSWGVP